MLSQLALFKRINGMPPRARSWIPSSRWDGEPLHEIGKESPMTIVANAQPLEVEDGALRDWMRQGDHERVKRCATQHHAVATPATISPVLFADTVYGIHGIRSAHAY
jgi:hypothetical protein